MTYQWTRKAQGSTQRSTCQCQDRQIGKPPIPEEVWSVDMQHRWSGGLRAPGDRTPSLPQAAQPKKEASKETNQGTDVQEQSGAVHGRSVARWHTPRPAVLGRAARPHVAKTRLPASRESYAPPLQLRTSGAT
jgi:hypothetical protein